MTSLKRALPMLMVLTASATAVAQPAPPVALPSSVPLAADAAPVQSALSLPPAAVLVASNEVVAVRHQIMALRLACAVMPLRTVVETPLPTRLANPGLPQTTTYRPYASEEQTCAAVSNQAGVGADYTWDMSLQGAALTLLALLFFMLVAGLVRVLWNGPMALLLPSRFAAKFFS